MAAGSFDHTATLMSVIGQTFGGKFVSPNKLNPFRQRPKTSVQKEAEAVEGRMALRAGLRALARGR